jgi:hypothetical protein
MSNVKISQLPSATTPLDGTEEIPMVQNSQTVKATIQTIRGGYNVYTALLTQSGTTNVVTQGIGSVTKGVTYQVDSYFANTDFSNVGGGTFDNPLQYFVASATATPNDYDGSILTSDTGAPIVASILENTIGNIWFTFNADGEYVVNSENLFVTDKTFVIIGSGTEGALNGAYITVVPGTNSSMNISSSSNFLAVNDELFNTSFEIRVYN